MGDLTKNFSLAEFLVSDTAEEAGIKNDPTPQHRKNLQATAEVLQMIRDGLERGVFIYSGYRNPEVNRLVGGTPTSDHPQGWCADITAAGMTAKQLALWISSQSAIMAKVDQLILETGRKVVHVSANPRRRHQVLTQAGPAGSPITVGIH